MTTTSYGQRHQRHTATWWSQFEECSERLDAASLTDALSDVITPGIPSMLLRREAEIATDVVLRHLNRPTSAELAEQAPEHQRRTEQPAPESETDGNGRRDHLGDDQSAEQRHRP